MQVFITQMFDLGFHQRYIGGSATEWRFSNRLKVQQQIDLATDRLSNGRIGQCWRLLTILPDNRGSVPEPYSGYTLQFGGVVHPRRGGVTAWVCPIFKTAKHSFKLQNTVLNCKTQFEVGSNIKLVGGCVQILNSKFLNYTEMCRTGKRGKFASGVNW